MTPNDKISTIETLVQKSINNVSGGLFKYSKDHNSNYVKETKEK